MLKNPSSITAQRHEEKIAYTLPYPGITPDHPLYFLKALRDRGVEFITRDPIKRAQLYLLYSDKRFAMADAVSEKGKIKLAITTLSKAEKYFLKIMVIVQNEKKNGRTLPADLKQSLMLSNQKHAEVLAIYLRDFPQGELEPLKEVIKINSNIGEELKKL